MMDTFLPKEFEPGRGRVRVRALKAKKQLHVKAGEVVYPVQRTWANGFAVLADNVPMLKGVVDVFDGTEHLYQCLITGSQTAHGERVFEIKRATPFEYCATTGIDAGMDMPLPRLSEMKR